MDIDRVITISSPDKYNISLNPINYIHERVEGVSEEIKPCADVLILDCDESPAALAYIELPEASEDNSKAAILERKIYAELLGMFQDIADLEEIKPERAHFVAQMVSASVYHGINAATEIDSEHIKNAEKVFKPWGMPVSLEFLFDDIYSGCAPVEAFPE